MEIPLLNLLRGLRQLPQGGDHPGEEGTGDEDEEDEEEGAGEEEEAVKASLQPLHCSQGEADVHSSDVLSRLVLEGGQDVDDPLVVKGGGGVLGISDVELLDRPAVLGGGEASGVVEELPHPGRVAVGDRFPALVEEEDIAQLGVEPLHLLDETLPLRDVHGRSGLLNRVDQQTGLVLQQGDLLGNENDIIDEEERQEPYPTENPHGKKIPSAYLHRTSPVQCLYSNQPRSLCQRKKKKGKPPFQGDGEKMWRNLQTLPG